MSVSDQRKAGSMGGWRERPAAPLPLAPHGYTRFLPYTACRTRTRSRPRTRPRCPLPAIRGLAVFVASVFSAVTMSTGAAVPAAADLVPAGLAATEYQAPPLGQIRAGRDSDPLMAQVAAEVQKAAAAVRAPVPLRDGRLDLVAIDIARATVVKRLPSFDAVAFLLRHYGLVEPEPYMVMVRSSPQGDVSLLADLRKQVPGVFKMGDWRRLGVGVKRGADELIVVLTLQPQNLELRGLPRRLPSRGTVTMVGRLLGRFVQPQVLVAVPRGGVRNLAMSARKGRFELTFACDSGDGVYQFEIEGDDGHGPAVLANFPLYCGVEPPARVTLTGSEVTRRQDAAEAERELLVLINRDRAAAGLPELTRDARLQEIARSHSRDMARTGEVFHVSAKSGSTEDRVRAAQVSPFPRTLAENAGRAFSTVEVEHGFMGSPGHRANVLNPDITHVGIGVAVGEAEGGVVPLFFTQLFAGW